jgi:hypothetical protein
MSASTANFNVENGTWENGSLLKERSHPEQDCQMVLFSNQKSQFG